MYGEPRFTQDIDIVLDLLPTQIAEFCAGFPTVDYDLNENSVRDEVAPRTQINVVHPMIGTKSISSPQGPARQSTQVARTRRTQLEDLSVMLAAPQDVILGKRWYYSLGGGDRHWRDIAGMLQGTAKPLIVWKSNVGRGSGDILTSGTKLSR